MKGIGTLGNSPSKAGSAHCICHMRAPGWVCGCTPREWGTGSLPTGTPGTATRPSPRARPEAAVPVLDSLPVLLLLPELSPRLSTEMPLKLLALVTAGFRLRRELSESVLLQGRGSVSVLLWWLLADLPDASLLILQVTEQLLAQAALAKEGKREKKKKKPRKKR